MGSVPRLSFFGGTLVLEGAARKAVAHTLAATPGVWDARVGGWRCDAIHYAMVLEQLRRRWNFEDQVPAWHPVHWPRVAIHAAAGEQAAVRAWYVAQRGCVVMPTGTGKTEVALSIMAAAATGSWSSRPCAI